MNRNEPKFALEFETTDAFEKPSFYIAAPFFNPTQNLILDHVKDSFDKVKIEYFSPKDECLYEPGKTTPQEVLDMNVEAIDKASHMLVVTNGKDVGTMFEAGYAYATGKSIIYLWVGGDSSQKFNLMLGASGRVCRSFVQLDQMLEALYSDITLDFQEGMTYE